MADYGVGPAMEQSKTTQIVLTKIGQVVNGTKVIGSLETC